MDLVDPFNKIKFLHHLLRKCLLLYESANHNKAISRKILLACNICEETLNASVKFILQAMEKLIQTQRFTFNIFLSFFSNFFISHNTALLLKLKYNILKRSYVKDSVLKVW